MQSKIHLAIRGGKNILFLLMALACTLALCYYPWLLINFAEVMVFGDYFYLLSAPAYIFYYAILYFCNRQSLRLKNLTLSSLMPIMFALPLFMPYYAAIMIALILAFCCGYNNRPLSKLFLQRNFRNFVAEKRTLYDINEHRRIENDDKVHSKNKIRKRSNCNLRFKAAYFYNLLFVFIYFFVSAIALIASYYLQFSQSCGYLQQQRTSLNNKLDIVNVLYHCGAATSYTNIVYIMPKGKRLSKFKALDSKYQAFSAYRCYLGDVDVKAINDNNIQITTNCTQHIKHARLIGGVRTSLKSF